ILLKSKNLRCISGIVTKNRTSRFLSSKRETFMETRRTSSLPILLIAAQFCIYFNSTTPAQARAVSDTVYEKTFSQKFAAIEIENANGRTEVETWNSSRIRVSASRNTIGDDRPISARIHFQVNDTD